MKLKNGIILSLLPIMLLTGCSKTNSSSSSSTSSQSSTIETSQATYPSTDAIKTAVNKAKKADQVDLIEAMEKDANVRFSDVVQNSDPEKYVGKVKLVDGEVFDTENTKSKDGKMYYIEDVTNKDHVYVLYTNKTGIRKDDSIETYGVIAGKMTYPTSDNKTEKAILITATKKNVQNNGATGK